MHNYHCVDCGAPVERLRKTTEPRCHVCRKARKAGQKYAYVRRNRAQINERTREYQREYQREHYRKTKNPEAADHLPQRYWANGETPLTGEKPIHVVGTVPGVGDEDWRYYISAYVGSTFQAVEFVCSAEDGCFDGLIVEHGARRYAVRDCRLEEVR